MDIKCGKKWTREDAERHAIKRDRTKAILEGMKNKRYNVAYADFSAKKILSGKREWNKLIKKVA